MPTRITPITVFVEDAATAEDLTATNPDSRYLTTECGTLNFHTLIAQHGAGEFTTLYVPRYLHGTFRPPIGGRVYHQ